MLWFSSKPNISSSCFQPNLKELNKNGAIDLELNILCVLLCPFAFIFHENACLQRNALWLAFMSRLKRQKKQTLEERVKLSLSEAILLLTFYFFWQITSLFKASVSSMKKKETEKQTGKHKAM